MVFFQWYLLQRTVQALVCVADRGGNSGPALAITYELCLLMHLVQLTQLSWLSLKIDDLLASSFVMNWMSAVNTINIYIRPILLSVLLLSVHQKLLYCLCGFCVDWKCCRKRNKDEQIFSQVTEKRREIKMSKEEELSEQKKREKEAARAYERWLNRKVRCLHLTVRLLSPLFHYLILHTIPSFPSL